MITIPILDSLDLSLGGREGGDLSPVNESSQPTTPAADTPGATGVSRSRTLPSVKGNSHTSLDDKQQAQQRGRVLRKQKRTSSHQPKTSESLTEQ